MSTLVPNCIITYPKDLSRLYLTINAVELPDLIASMPTDIKLTINKDGQPTVVNDLSIINNLILTLTGSVNITEGNIDVIGVATMFLTEVKVGDILQLNGLNTKNILVSSIVSDTLLKSNSTVVSNENGLDATIIRPVIEVMAGDMFIGATELIDGNYEIFFTYEYGINSYTSPAGAFEIYVFANEYKCVESKLMNLALYCSEDCVDMNTLKYTLLLKALLDSMEVILSEDVVDTTALGIVKEKINRYCLLLNNNCTSC